MHGFHGNLEDGDDARETGDGPVPRTDPEDADPVPADVQINFDTDDGALVEPFDPRIVPELLARDQSDVNDVITHEQLNRTVLSLRHRDHSAHDEYHTRGLKKITLGELKEMYELRLDDNALALLRNRLELKTDDDLLDALTQHTDIIQKTVGSLPADVKERKPDTHLLIEEEQEVADVKFVLYLVRL